MTRGIVTIVVGLALIVGLAACGSGSPTASPTVTVTATATVTAAPAETAPTTDAYTLEMYQAIKNGMTLDEVRAITGDDGKLVEENQGGAHQAWMWRNPDFSYMLIGFTDGVCDYRSMSALGM